MPDHESQTCHSILQTCHRFKMIGSSRKSLLLRIYLHSNNFVPKLKLRVKFRKIKVSMRKITAAFGISSGFVTDIAQYVYSKKWKSARLILSPQYHSWFTLMGLILAVIKFGEFGDFWRNSPNLIPAKILKNDHSPN